MGMLLKIRRVLVGWKKRLQYRFEGPKETWPVEKRIRFVLSEYKHMQGYVFDIRHPELFTEKILWYKVFYDNPEMKRIVDKVAFKAYIEEKLGPGHTIPMFGAWDSLEAFEKAWDSLPEEFVLKSNASSAGENIRIVHHKSGEDLSRLKKQLARWLDPLHTLIEGDALGYYGLRPMILAEEYKSNVSDQLYDYKLFCFDGEPRYVYVAQDHFGKDGSHISFYDLDWNKLDVRYGKHIVGDAPRPAHFEQMKALAARLAPGFPFVRVDFFDTGDELFLAEMTFYPGGGFTPYHPEAFNREMGERFILPQLTENE